MMKSGPRENFGPTDKPGGSGEGAEGEFSKEELDHIALEEGGVVRKHTRDLHIVDLHQNHNMVMALNGLILMESEIEEHYGLLV